MTTISKVYDYIVEHKAKTAGVSPTLREIRDGAGISSTSLVRYTLDILEKRGRIRRPAGSAVRWIELPGERWIPPDDAQ